ncbi:lysophospholipid acyltransferase family protein [Aliikangiella sp. G2MR2-5]|uniref:lysophospholipid acyltransferase family protein n=1 Tax=Aliikangiella sp. G2MR2-5 TaxID=2788943 RepID=UPI0018A8FFB3|nr:lysophospholipid acyltransferase family protein [Aliikangiella sp. G2MR2-5]
MFAWLCRKILSLFGWEIVGKPPEVKKYVAIVAPHTSNWDFFIFVLMKFGLRMKVNFIGKHTIFVGPVGWFLKKLGGIPVNRSASHNIVNEIVNAFKQREEMVFALAPEGTRSYRDHWKSGFYHIALSAEVPVQFCYLDAPTKKLGFGPLIKLTGDEEKDLASIRDFYHDKRGIRQELFSDIKFKENKKIK